MKVIKKINNNVALAINERKEEILVVGKGLGFKKTPYEITEDDIVEKIYVSPKNIKMFDLLNDIPMEDIYLAEEIIKTGKELVTKELNPNLILTLSDHISFAIQRSKENIPVKSPLEWEVKTLYPEETKIGIKALEIIQHKRGIHLPKSEITFIALHFINAQIGSGEMNETTKITRITGEILSIIRYYYKMDFDETALFFSRFATHIRYFIMRHMTGNELKGESEGLYQVVEEKYPIEMKCVEKIQTFLHTNYKWNCSNDEKLYLVLHIHRLSQSNK